MPKNLLSICVNFALATQPKNEELKNAGYHHPLFFIHHYCAFALVILSAASKMPSLPDSYVRPPCI